MDTVGFWNFEFSYLHLRLILPRLSPFLPAASPVDYTTNNYPNGTENANPDEDIGQHTTKGDQSVPSGTGNTTRTPARADNDITFSGPGIGVAPVIGYLQRDGIAPGILIGMDGVRTCARFPITEVPLIAIR